MTTQAMDAAAIRSAAEEWIDHRLVGEPAAVSAMRPAYVQHHLERCVRAIRMLPPAADGARLLEVGSGIYLMTFLLERLTAYRLELSQFWSRPAGDYQSVLESATTGRRRSYRFKHFNAETDRFPYADGSFDVVVLCELIEHLLCNPLRMLGEIHRVLRPGGTMLITTPNVLRLSNLTRLLRGRNVYDKYASESPNARHPREYTPAELQRLVEWAGFRLRHCETADVTRPEEGPRKRALAALLVRLADALAIATRQERPVPPALRGEQIFLVAERAGAPREDLPDFLFEQPLHQKQVIDAICGPPDGAPE